MKTLDIFVVELEKQIDDTIKTEGGLELYVDTRFNEFKHRITEGPVVAAPIKHNTGVKEGDTLYFHHLVVMNEGQMLTGDDNHYIVQFDPNQTINNQAIAYKSKKSGHIHPLAGWSLMEPIEVEKEKPSESLEVVSFSETPVKKAKVAFDAPWISELGVKKGDVIGLPKNRDYEITIEGKKYFRVRTEDFLYVEEEVHND
tara:strand:- start:376 stop:975 length:600 start_codon:yes stop_codon:yes gene_type:complete